ncbi:hypothetical protein A2U01_0053176, partial [Trifolium medium]|nr:hypothetical protein [Trifolium medium]
MDLDKSPPKSPNYDSSPSSSSSSSSTPESLHDDSADLSLINDNDDSLTHSPWHSPPPSPANYEAQIRDTIPIRYDTDTA